ncbi:glucosyltransferase domain-containing protein [Massilia brevitalea]|uniref:glucosyltransferase domain-containing protein n=1 Tax=Massilia brevitalea TaxID=442526 RepID=UPI00273A4C4F|nr:glucosyltransferase domain-containing protein [Massilia brevitalea]
MTNPFPMRPSPLSSQRALPLLPLLLPTLLTLLLLWLPFGFGMTGHIEEWGLLGLFTMQGALPVAWVDGPLGAHAVRPLMPLTFWIAHALSPDSFVAWHLLQIAALAIKGIAAAALAWRATRSAAWAAWFGPLVILYPADTMQLSFRSLHINWSLALALLAGALLLYGLEWVRRRRRYMAAAVAAFLLFLGCCMYEAALTLVPLPFVVMMARWGWRGFWSRVRAGLGPLLIFVGGAFLYLGYAKWVAGQVASYQGTIAGGGRSIVAVLFESLPKLFSIGYARALFGGWIDAARMIRDEFANPAYLVFVTVVLALAIFFVWKRSSAASAEGTQGHADKVHPLWLMFGGLVACALGYAPFLLLPTHQVISQRTFLWASPGAALAFLALLLLLGRVHRALAAGPAVLLLLGGFAAQLFQFHHYENISRTQQAQLRAIVSNFDGNFAGKTLVVLDESNSLGHTWTFPEGSLEPTLAYLYGHATGTVQVCHWPAGEWVHSDSLGRRGSCVRDDNGWTFTPAGRAGPPEFAYADPVAPVRLDAAQAIVLTIGADFRGRLEGAAAPTAANTTRTARELGSLQPGGGLTLLHGMFRDEQPNPSYRWSFGDWWSLEQPTRGYGWREVEWQAEGMEHVSLAWKTAPVAGIQFMLAPVARPYVLRGRFGAFASEAVRQDVTALVNGHALTLKPGTDGSFSIDVPASWLRPGANDLALRAPVDLAYYGLSFQLDWFEIAPQ